jgi:prepilin-type N-terminal cleavage/methylation domain-containing protein/prepilin-type processing-associated H-X9-DG protein
MIPDKEAFSQTRKQQMNSRKLKNYGFTMIELLVVIAIIAVLAGILFPIFAGAKQSGYRTDCLARMNQLGKAFIMYCDDHEEKMLPSTNYGDDDTNPEKIWPNDLKAYIKSENVFIAPDSNGLYADGWDKRGWASIGYNSSTALDEAEGCTNDQADLKGCLAFKAVADVSKSGGTVSQALFAVTPAGDVANEYLGYEFSPYNGVPMDPPAYSPPLVSDSDLVKSLTGTLPAEMIKPIYARYESDGKDDGQTPIAFADGHCRTYSAKQIASNDAKILWRLR